VFWCNLMSSDVHEPKRFVAKQSVGVVLQSVAECRRVLQCVAVCCSVLQCITVCCSVLQRVAVCCSNLVLSHVPDTNRFVALQCVAVLLHCAAERCSVTACDSALQCNAVCCSVLQCITVRCSVVLSSYSV